MAGVRPCDCLASSGLRATGFGFAEPGAAFSWSRCLRMSVTGSPNLTGLGPNHSWPRDVGSHPHLSERSFANDVSARYQRVHCADQRYAQGCPAQVSRAIAKEAPILVSSVVAFELWYGAAKSQRKETNTEQLEAFLAGPLEWTLFDDEDAREAGMVRAELEIAGKPIGAYDVLIAGQARRRGATLVTSNVAKFDRVARLKWEDWAAARR